MNAIEILKKDHREIKDILNSITGSSDTAIKTREKLITKLADAIKLHTKIEEKLIYPLALKHSSLETQTREAYEEHNAVDLLLEKVLKVSVNDESWLAKCIVVKENLEHHIGEEEKELFPALAKLLSGKELSEIGKKVLEMKEKEERAKGSIFASLFT